MIKLREENLNFKNKKTCDCVIRALANASGKDYKQVASELFDLYMKYGYMINDKHTYERWLENNGFVKYKQPRKSDNTKYLVGEIDKLVRLGENVVIRLANHLSSVSNNELVDIWDCRYKTIGNYYVKEVEND